MNPKPISQEKDPDMRTAHEALIRAGQRAREIAAKTGTAVVVMRDGKKTQERVQLKVK